MNEKVKKILLHQFEVNKDHISYYEKWLQKIKSPETREKLQILIKNTREANDNILRFVRTP